MARRQGLRVTFRVGRLNGLIGLDRDGDALLRLRFLFRFPPLQRLGF